jgi:hypothetical protein
MKVKILLIRDETTSARYRSQTHKSTSIKMVKLQNKDLLMNH